MTPALLLDLLTKGATYELHEIECDVMHPSEYGDTVCDCPGPDLLKEIKEALKRAK